MYSFLNLLRPTNEYFLPKFLYMSYYRILNKAALKLIRPNIIIIFNGDISIVSNSPIDFESKLSAIVRLILLVELLNYISYFFSALSSSELLESSNLLGGVLPSLMASSLS